MLYLFLGIICVVVLFWVLTPLLAASPQTMGPAPGNAGLPAAANARLLELSEERDNLLRALRDLDFDRSTGKVDEAGYNNQRADLASQTSRLLDAIDQLENPRAMSIAQPGWFRLIDWLELEVIVQRLRNSRAKSWSCAKCNRAMTSKDDRFCGSCGAPRDIAATKHAAVKEGNSSGDGTF